MGNTLDNCCVCNDSVTESYTSRMPTFDKRGEHSRTAFALTKLPNMSKLQSAAPDSNPLDNQGNRF
eukprot:748756-Hanusia_phi.AAC.1